MFLLKKIVSPLFFPVALCLEILSAGLILLWFTRQQRAGKLLVSAGVVLLALLSYNSVADMLLEPLEARYPALQDPKASVSSGPEGQRSIKWVVVLGGGRATDERISVVGRLKASTLFRLTEGIRIFRKLPGSKLLLSGGGDFHELGSEAQGMAEVAIALGVSEQDLVLETSSKDTKDQAQFVKKIVGNERFILVTSASHMLRSIALFRKQGMDPIPAPTGHWAKRRMMKPRDFYPLASALRKSERAIYEYLGLAWAKLRGQMQ